VLAGELHVMSGSHSAVYPVVAPPCSWTPEETQVESCGHQDNANIHCQPFPESVSEEHDIYADYDGCHHHHTKMAASRRQRSSRRPSHHTTN